jgi:MtN3 and saliva related transmembrane protein
MDWTNFFGYAAAICTTVAFLPQVIKTLKERKTEDISLGMYVIFTLGITMWLMYGILKNELPIILANSVTLVFALMILGLKIKHG